MVWYNVSIQGLAPGDSATSLECRRWLLTLVATP